MPTRTFDLTPELVGRLPGTVPDPGGPRITDAPEGFHERHLHAILQRRDRDGTLPLFAAGSLLWKRPFESLEERPARVAGWHRAFCVGPDTALRGNPGAPGLMLSLDEGGACDGLLLRLPAEGLHDTLRRLLDQEPPFPPAWVRAHAGGEAVAALTFASRREHPLYRPEPPGPELARLLARAVGPQGSMPDYLRRTVEALAARGLHDPALWRLQALVAREMERLPPAAAA